MLPRRLPDWRALLLAAAAVCAAPAQASLTGLDEVASPALATSLQTELPGPCDGELCDELEVPQPQTRVRGFELDLHCRLGGEDGLSCRPRQVWLEEYGEGASDRLVYAKARYFDPELGRFLSQDSYLGELTNPPSLHRYVYADDRPTYYVDPDGHDDRAADELAKALGRTPLYPINDTANEVTASVGRRIKGTATGTVDLVQTYTPMGVAAEFGGRLLGGETIGEVTTAVVEERFDPKGRVREAARKGSGYATAAVGAAGDYLERSAGVVFPIENVKTALDPNAPLADRVEAGLDALAQFALLGAGAKAAFEERVASRVPKPTNNYDRAAWRAYWKAHPEEARSVGAAGDGRLRRPYIRKEVAEKVENTAPRTADGRPIDPNTLQPIDVTPDRGHKFGREFRRERAKAEAEGLAQKDFNDRMNDPDLYQLEDPSSNRSHKYEKPGNN